MVRRYKPDTDFEQISNWLKDRNLKVFHPDSLPKIGFIVDDLAAIFLYQTDSSIAYLESLVSNPRAPYEARADAVAQVIDTGMQAAAILGFKFVLAVTSNKRVVIRAAKKGAKITGGNYLITKQLK